MTWNPKETRVKSSVKPEEVVETLVALSGQMEKV
jgi:hypothetical protein